MHDSEVYELSNYLVTWQCPIEIKKKNLKKSRGNVFPNHGHLTLSKVLYDDHG